MSKVKELEQRLAHSEQQVGLLQRLSRYLVRDNTQVQEALEDVVHMVTEFMQSEACLIYLLENNELILCASNSPHPTTVGKLKLALNEGLTGWVARERRLLAISREAYQDPRFKYFKDLPEDSFEAFLSAPVISRQRMEGVINVQHRHAHAHTGLEMELLTTVGEQLGSLVMLARSEKSTQSHAELAFSSTSQGVGGI